MIISLFLNPAPRFSSQGVVSVGKRSYFYQLCHIGIVLLILLNFIRFIFRDADHL